MIPIRDDVPARGVPLVNVGLIAVNALFFFFELTLSDRELPRFIRQVAVVPAAFFPNPRVATVGDLAVSAFNPALETRVFLSMFLHGGWAHILGNMLYLWVFGDNVEDRMGHFRYLVFYLLCGWIATFTHIVSDPLSRLPSIGASGAIAGVLGAYLALYPRARVYTVVPLFIFFPIVQIPAILFLGFWFLTQFYLGAISTFGVETAQTVGIAVWAHIGGFLSGLALVWVFQDPRRRPPPRDAWWEYSQRRPAQW
jgi:membrane associated rhomboid family serine protease